MPLRGLLYFAREYEGMLKEMELNPFSERLVRLPAPQYYALYNGEKALPEQMEYRLSQAFDRPAEGYEWTAKVININAGCQSELMRRCPSLRGYAELIARIRAGQQNGLEFGAAVDEAVDSCIADGFLAEFLKKHKGEVKSMFLTGVDPKWYARIVRKEAREDGREQMSELILCMIQSGHEDDIKRVAEDSDYRSAMLRQYGIEE